MLPRSGEPPVSTRRHPVCVPNRRGVGIELLADPTRRQILAAVAVRPARPSSLAARLGRSRPAVSRQLRLLEEAELIRGHRMPGDGRAMLYTINPLMHGRITAWLAGTEVGRRFDLAGPAAPPQERLRDP